ncbi:MULTISPECIES: hypothetical protein [Cupriavidus]|uniref:Uncharacterized protein n=1 Tax=Cupriavidus oxalaticus TaxID=96344 RepID=A0A4P7LGD9_9BURK|nr:MULTISPECIES: hypothetical protein [Cupriavidus]MBF6991747.1 hypothetical protein [Cupriavidus sp. IK-TO18]QBY52283.1 hypothetical protein E0W60_13775 [Cupriavidus oxalaticus]
MTAQHYFGYLVHGTAHAGANGLFEASGLVEHDGAPVNSSGPLGCHPTRERAIAEGIAWGKVWVDMRVRGYTDVRAGARKPAAART